MPPKRDKAEPLDLGKLPDDYVNEDAIIETQQAAKPGGSATTLMSWLYRAVVPNRWPK